MDGPGRSRAVQARAFPCKRYVEFGSGGTTVFADRLGLPSISVESDRSYARAVASRLSSGSVRQIVVDLGLPGEWGAPLFNTPAKGRRYMEAPWEGRFPGLILVDGRYRVACALESARRAYEARAQVIMLIDDYATRRHYHLVESFLPLRNGRARCVFFDRQHSGTFGTVEAMLLDKR